MVETWQVYGMDGELLAEYAASGAAASPQKEYGYRNGQLLITAEAGQAGMRTNVALATNGGIATASTDESPYAISYANDGERLGYNSGHYSFWRDSTANSWPDWLQVDFNGNKTIDEIDVLTVQDSAETPATPTEALTFTFHGITAFEVQYWDGSGWQTVPGGSVTGNNKVWRKFTFTPVTNSVNTQGVVDVISKGGITRQRLAAPGPGPGTAWPDPNNKLRYFTQRAKPKN